MLSRIDVLALFVTFLIGVGIPCLFSSAEWPSSRRHQRSAAGTFYDDPDTTKYRNGLSSMFSFQNPAREPSAGPRHVRQQPGKMDGFGTGSAAIGGANNDVYWMSPDPNSPDLQTAWTGTGGSGTAAGAGGAAAMAQQQTGAATSVPAGSAAITASASQLMNAAAAAYGIQQQQQQAQQSLSAQQMAQQPAPPQSPQLPLAQQQQSMALAQQQQQPQQQQVQQQQQQPMSMMQMPYQQGGGAYGYGGQQLGGYGMSGVGAGYGSSAGGQAPVSPYSSYLEKQISTYPIMIYTLSECIPCQRAKHLLAVHYPDVRAHYLELSGNEAWQQQLQIDLQYLTGAITFPYIFVCGQYIGGASELFELHESGQLRRMVAQCLKTAPPK